MTIIEKGKPYPYHNRANGTERPVLETNTAFFDVLLYSQQAKKDARFWGSDPLKLYPLIYENIPVLAVRFPKQKFDFDVSLNFLKVDEGARDNWLSAKGNVVNFVLIDAKANIVQGLRTISVNFSDSFRKACKGQLRDYANHHEVDVKIMQLESQYSTAQIIAKSKNN